MSRRSKRNRKSKRHSRNLEASPTLPEVVSFCPRTGAVFATPLTGRYQDWPRPQLEERLDALRAELALLGVVEPGCGPATPPWLRAESLEVLLAFEQDPPCGCRAADHLPAGSA